MTRTEFDSNQDRENSTIHRNGHEVMKERARIAWADGVIQGANSAPELDAGAKEASGMVAAMTAMLLPAILLTDCVIAIPPLEDRFESLGLPPGLAFAVAIATALLLMCMETLAALAWFRAYERSLQSRRYAALLGWTIISLVVVAGPVLMGLSQLYVVLDGSLDDTPRLYKEVALVLLFGGAHLLLISSGRYLETSKHEALLWLRKTWAEIVRHFARRAEQKSHDLLSNAYRVHVRNATRAVKEGFEGIEIGPFEDAVLALIRERHATVDDTIRSFSIVMEAHA